MARSSDRFGQYSADQPVTSAEDPRMQYTTDVPTTTQTDYSWRAPTHPTAHRPPRGAISFAGGGAPGGGGGGGAALSQGQVQHRLGDEFEQRWRHSEERADRIRRQYEGFQPWSASPEDYEDVLGPNRSGGLEKVATLNPQPGLRRNEPPIGGAGVPARPKPPTNGNGLSGGAAQKVPSPAGTYL